MKIFVLDDDPQRHEIFEQKVQPTASVYVAVRTYQDAVEALAREKFDLLYLDRDLNDFGKHSIVKGVFTQFEMTGEDVVKFLLQNVPKEIWPDEIIIHSWNTSGAKRMLADLREAGLKASWQLFNGGKHY